MPDAAPLDPELRAAIVRAFEFRGHVTIDLAGGGAVDGFLYNWSEKGDREAREPFVELFLKGSGDQQRVRLAEIAEIRITGEDCAARNPYVPGQTRIPGQATPKPKPAGEKQEGA